MEQKVKKLYTTHEVARLLGVTPITVIRWIESGRFKCFMTVGGHRRIEHGELKAFAQAHNLPWTDEEELQERKDFIVLAVDDDEDILEVLKDMLEDVRGLKLITCSNGFTAGAKLVEDRPNMILLDFKMPELDGFEFCRFIRQDPRFHDLIVVAMSGLKSDEDIARMREVGVHEVMTKPFGYDALQEQIQKYRLAA
jgi:excisionase family DNA binding protein